MCAFFASGADARDAIVSDRSADCDENESTTARDPSGTARAKASSSDANAPRR